MENDYLDAIKNNDLSTLKLMLLSDETLVKTKDYVIKSNYIIRLDKLGCI